MCTSCKHFVPDGLAKLGLVPGADGILRVGGPSGFRLVAADHGGCALDPVLITEKTATCPSFEAQAA